ncbi:MAG: hypothetical protein IJU72_04500 [Bacteroidales bacterium]|nr:hypothetical protein [Bacteroidales bacterium]
MKRVFLALALLGICGTGMAQVQDNAVIPVSVTINSVLRMQVNSGGNIQFVFNTMDQFLTGITSTGNTTTKFTVSSSRPYTVTLNSEDANLMGISTGATANLALLRYSLSGLGANTTTQPLTNTSQTVVTNADPASNEDYSIMWEAGTDAGNRATGIPPDTYVTNVFLTLVPN